MARLFDTPQQREMERQRRRRAAQRFAEEIAQRNAVLPPAECACGCGVTFPALNSRGLPRRYAKGHQKRGPEWSAPQRAALESIERAWLAVSAAVPQFEERPACADADPKLFFAPYELTTATREQPSERARREEKAKAICGGCPVRAQCLDWALANLERDGIWGGLSPWERRELQRRRTVAA